MRGSNPQFRLKKGDVDLAWEEGSLVGFSPRGLKSGAFKDCKVVGADLVERMVEGVRNPRPVKGPLGIRWPWDHIWEGELVFRETGRQITLDELRNEILKRLTPGTSWEELYGLRELRKAVQNAKTFDDLVKALDEPPSDWDTDGDEEEEDTP